MVMLSIIFVIGVLQLKGAVAATSVSKLYVEPWGLHSIRLTWLVNKPSTEVIERFRVNMTRMAFPRPVVSTIELTLAEVTRNGGDYVKTMSNMVAGASYMVQVAAITSGSYVGTGDLSNVGRVKTSIAAPPAPVNFRPNVVSSAHSVDVSLWQASDVNGPVKWYKIIACETNKKPTKRPRDFWESDFLSYTDMIKKKKTEWTFEGECIPYVAGKKLDARPFKATFTLGVVYVDNGKFVGFDARKRRNVPEVVVENPALKPETQYYLFERAYVSQDHYTSSPDWIPAKTVAKPANGFTDEEMAGIIIAIIVLFLIPATVLIACYKRNRSKEV